MKHWKCCPGRTKRSTRLGHGQPPPLAAICLGMQTGPVAVAVASNIAPMKKGWCCHQPWKFVCSADQSLRLRSGARQARQTVIKNDQEASAPRARAVISSTVPVPLMARYLGAAAASALAQLL